MSERIAEMTIDQLTSLINRIVEERLDGVGQEEYWYKVGEGGKSLLERIRANVIATPAGVPTPSKMIEEERALC